MIAFARDCSESKYSASVPEATEPAWHAGFLALLPAVRDQLRFTLRGLSPDERAEAMAECIASIAVSYAKLHARGKTDVAFVCTLADFAVRQYFAGRRVGNKLNSDDVTSPYAQRRRRICVKSLDQRNPAGEWKEIVVEDGRATPADVAASRIDLDDWFSQLPSLKRGIAQRLATGETTKDTAREFDLTPGRISQLRRELEVDWLAFHGESLEDGGQPVMATC